MRSARAATGCHVAVHARRAGIAMHMATGMPLHAPHCARDTRRVGRNAPQVQLRHVRVPFADLSVSCEDRVQTAAHHALEVVSEGFVRLLVVAHRKIGARVAGQHLRTLPEDH
jgi:hypothetical protein